MTDSLSKVKEVKKVSLSFRDIVRRVDKRNETAAVDIYGRILLGLIGLTGAVLVFIFADPSDKVLGLVFLFIPILPVVWGVTDDYLDAKNELLAEKNE